MLSIDMNSKIVIATNVFVSALISPSSFSREVIRRSLMATYQPLMGNTLFMEYESILSLEEVLSKCPLTIKEIETLLAALMNVSQWILIYYLWRPNLKDEGDNHVIELAIAGNAEAIVTNNVKDFQNSSLLFPELLVLRPEEILKR